MSDLKKDIFYASTNPDALYGHIKTLQTAMLGDFKIAIEPKTIDLEATEKIWSKEIKVSLVDTKGDVHTWFTKDVVTGVSVEDNSVAGTATIDSTTLSFVDGVATVIVSGGATAWLKDETVTVTVANASVNGITATGGTCVITIIEAVVVTP